MIISIRLLAILLISLPGFSAQAQPVQTDSIVYTVTQQPPGFPGGIDKFNQYLRKNMHYPRAAQRAGLEGRVFIAFIVSEQGRIEETHILKSLTPEMDAEAVRSVRKMPNWIPGKVNGKPVACRYNVVVNFSL